MKIPDYTATIQEPVVCVRPGRLPLLKLCIAVLCVIGAAAIAAVIWAEVTGFNLNSLPWIPRIALAVIAGLSAWGIYRSIREEQVELKLSCYRDRLTLSYAARPSLWREGAPAQTAELRYSDVQSCVFSTRRLRVTFQTKAYLLTVGDGQPKKKSGAVSFSTLSAPNVDFAGLLKKHTPLKAVTRN